MAKKDSKGSEKGVLERFFGSDEERTETSAESGESQSATDLLKQQHEEVRKLFKEYKSAGERAHSTRKKIMDTAGEKLDVHAKLEETIFYPACRSLNDEKAQKMVGESLEEHAIVKRLIREMRGLDGSDENFEAKASVLMENVEHHADEEERDLFPVAERELEDEELVELGAEMAALQQRLMTRERSGRKTSSRSGGRRTARA
jgi:hemerythrin-like domain-containing protein